MYGTHPVHSMAGSMGALGSANPAIKPQKPSPTAYSGSVQRLSDAPKAELLVEPLA